MRHSFARIFGLAVAVGLLLSRTGAAAQTVVLVLAGGSQQELAPMEQRLRSELLSAGFAVTAVQVPSVLDEQGLSQTATGMLTKAAIAVVLSDSGVSGFVWATAQDDERTLFRPIRPVPWSDDLASVFAIRATELLNAMLIELGYPKRRSPDGEQGARPAPPAPPADEQPPPAPTRPPQQTPPHTAPAPDPERAEPRTAAHDEPAWSVAVGAAVIGGPGGIAPAGAAVLSLARRLGLGFRAQAMLAGPVLGSVHDESGDSSVDQELGALRLSWEQAALPWLNVFAVAGAGAHRLGVSGNATAPLQGNDDEVWSVLSLVGAGARCDLGRSLSVVLEGDLLATFPRGRVVFIQRTVARTGRPLLLGGVAVAYAW